MVPPEIIVVANIDRTRENTRDIKVGDEKKKYTAKKRQGTERVETGRI
jgi:hypothetical protein